MTWSTSYKGLIDEFPATGRPYPLPSWVHKGAVIGTMGGTQFMQRAPQKTKGRGAVLSGYWLQDWVGTRIGSNEKDSYGYG